MKNKTGTWKRLLLLIRPYGALLTVALLFAALTVAATLYTPVLIGNGIDIIIGAGAVDFAALVPILIKIAVTVLVTAVSQWLMTLCTNRVTFLTVRDVRVKAFSRLQRVPLRYIDGRGYGEIISRMISDVEQISEGLLLGFAQLFTGVITIIGTLGFMLSINVRITLVVVLITPLSLFVASFIAKRTFAMFQLQSKTRGELTSLVEELVGNEKLVQAFSYEQRAQARFDEVNERLRVCGLRATFFSSTTNPATRFVNGLVYAGVGILGALFAMRGILSIGQLTCFLSYANQYTKPFNEISGVVAELQNALACANRVFALIDAEEEPAEPIDAVTLARADGQLRLSQVAFSYRPEAPLISDLNLTVHTGQRIAIVGPTGCGKTTMINLLMRFYDTVSGEILIGGAASETDAFRLYPVRQVTRDSLRAMFGMVLQETWLKTGTIRENIAYGRPDATQEEIIAAAKAAYAHNFIRRLPQGYDTVVSDDKQNISQGQKQLLCIARVMLLAPPILILDEATSSIDTMTEKRVQLAFARMMQGRTSFIVAHRLSTIREADCILVMNAGHIVEQGTHEQLLAQNGFYASMYRSQFSV